MSMILSGCSTPLQLRGLRQGLTFNGRWAGVHVDTLLISFSIQFRCRYSTTVIHCHSLNLQRNT